MRVTKNRASISATSLIKIGDSYIAEYIDVYENGRLSSRSDGEYLLELRSKLFSIQVNLIPYQEELDVKEYISRADRLPFANAYYLANKEYWREKVKSSSKEILLRYDALEAEIKTEQQGYYTDILLGRIESNRNLLTRAAELNEKELVMARAIVYSEGRGGLSVEYHRWRPTEITTYRGQQILMKEVMKNAG